MPAEVITKMLIVAIAVTLVGIASSILIFLTSTTSLKSEIAVEKADLTTSISVIALKNIGNTRIVGVEKVLIDCESMDLDVSSYFGQTIPVGGTYTAIIDTSDLRSGELCRIYVEGLSETGEKLAYTSSYISVRS
ncbi:MAG: hypothetical protein QXY26_09085 [Ignisphaera sp.]